MLTLNHNREMEPADRISSLPTHLIHLIFSSLNTVQAVQTSVLSKRWTKVWASNPFLIFKQSQKFCLSSDKFFKFLDKVLTLRDESNIHTFHFTDPKFDGDRPRNKHFKFLANRNVEEFKLCGSTITWGTLSYITPQVKTVILTYCWISVDLKFPVLETLVLENIQFVNDRRYVITAPKLKYLSIIESALRCYVNIVIRAPHLKELVIDGCLYNHYWLQKKSALDAVEVIDHHFDHFFDNLMLRESKKILRSILEGAVNIKSLTLHAATTVQGPSSSLTLSHQIQKVLCKIKNLSHLKVTNLTNRHIPALLELLKNTPCVETLILEEMEKDFLDSWRSNGIDNLSWDSKFPCLKFIQMKNVKGSKNELKLLEAMLKGGIVLEEISIKSAASLQADDEKELDEFVSKLLKLAKASLGVKIYLDAREIPCV